VNIYDRVYTYEGYEVIVIAYIKDGYVIRHAIETDDGVVWGKIEEYYGALYEEPPTQKIHEEIKDLLKQKEEAENAKNDAIRMKNEAEAEFESSISKLEEHKPLKNILAFLEREFTHVVVLYSLEIIPFEKLGTGDSNWDGRCIRMMSLKGTVEKNKIDLAFYLSKYSDESGHSSEILLATSEEEANRMLKDHIVKVLNEADCSTESLGYDVRRHVKRAIDLDIPVQIPLLKRYFAHEVKGSEEELDNIIQSIRRDEQKSKEIEKKIAEIKALEARLLPLEAIHHEPGI
jgi:hypothetical protein